MEVAVSGAREIPPPIVQYQTDPEVRVLCVTLVVGLTLLSARVTALESRVGEVVQKTEVAAPPRTFAPRLCSNYLASVESEGNGAGEHHCRESFWGSER